MRNADLFGVSADLPPAQQGVFRKRIPPRSRKSEISFAPDERTLQLCRLTGTWPVEWFYSEGSVSLFDVTANQTLWDYSWTFPNSFPAPTGLFNEDGSEDWTCLLETNLMRPTYALSMREQSWADSDNQQIALQLSGLTVVRTFSLLR